MAFLTFSTWRPSAILNFKNAFGLQTPITAKCSLFNVRLLCNGRYYGNLITTGMRGHDGMRPLKFPPNKSTSRRVTTFPTFSIGRSSAILNVKNFNIWSYDCHRLPNLLLCTKFHQNWFTRSASRRP